MSQTNRPNIISPDVAEEAALPPLPEPPAEELPQGIVIRHMQSGNPVKDFHPKHRHIPMIDPESLVVDGKDPALALPVAERPGEVVIKRVGRVAAAEMLTCDWASGGRPVHRLATTAETEEMEARLARRRAEALNKGGAR